MVLAIEVETGVTHLTSTTSSKIVEALQMKNLFFLKIATGKKSVRYNAQPLPLLP